MRFFSVFCVISLKIKKIEKGEKFPLPFTYYSSFCAGNRRFFALAFLCFGLNFSKVNRLWNIPFERRREHSYREDHANAYQRGNYVARLVFRDYVFRRQVIRRRACKRGNSINMLSQNIGNEQDLFQNESSFAVIFIRNYQKVYLLIVRNLSIIIHRTV